MQPHPPQGMRGNTHTIPRAPPGACRGNDDAASPLGQLAKVESICNGDQGATRNMILQPLTIKAP